MAVNPLTKPIPQSLIEKLTERPLPIKVVRGTIPPKFRWWQLVNTPTGVTKVMHESTVLPSMEGALLSLIQLCEHQEAEIKALRHQVSGMVDRIAAQSELLSKQAEKPVPSQPQPKKGK